MGVSVFKMNIRFEFSTIYRQLHIYKDYRSVENAVCEFQKRGKISIKVNEGLQLTTRSWSNTDNVIDVSFVDGCTVLLRCFTAHIQTASAANASAPVESLVSFESRPTDQLIFCRLMKGVYPKCCGPFT